MEPIELTGPALRVAIAKDVLKGLKAMKLITTRGNWVRIPYEFGFTSNLHASNEPPEEELAEVLNGKTCEVCALGALFVETVKRCEKLKCDRKTSCASIELISEYLKPIFSNDQLRMIEIAYECGLGQFDPNCSTELRAKEFGQERETNDGRMIAIMENIIKNNGEFIP